MRLFGERRSNRTNEFSLLSGSERRDVCDDAVNVGDDCYVAQFFVPHILRLFCKVSFLKINT